MNKELLDFCADGDIAGVMFALLSGADINYSDEDGVTPLNIAVEHNQTLVVKELLSDDRTDTTAADNDGNTALHIACLHSSVGCIALLGQDLRMTVTSLNQRNKEGHTPVMLAVYEGNLECVEEMGKLQGVFWEVEDEAGNSLEVQARSIADRRAQILSFIQKRKNNKTIPYLFNAVKSSGSRSKPTESKQSSTNRKPITRVETIGPGGWVKANARMLDAVDQNKYAGFVQEQVDMLGGCKTFYNEVANSLTSGIKQFIKEEQKSLYEWRSTFFREKFKCIYFGDPRPSAGKPVESTFYWTTDGGDDAHCMDTEPYQVTERFDKLMELAASTVRLNLDRERIYFENYEGCPGKDILYNDEPSFRGDDEWEDEDYDYCYLVEEGKLCTEGLCYCSDCERRKEKYIQYLRGSDAIKKRYLKWRKEEDEKGEENEEEDEYMLQATPSVNSISSLGSRSTNPSPAVSVPAEQFLNLKEPADKLQTLKREIKLKTRALEERSEKEKKRYPLTFSDLGW
eukprot:GFUD01041515.1.p1 GENE.GFUD01041515.1~~GFUD01041515.1.p1  ORF type:complete len:513 (+),score=141.33 GFUD01041515.1:60-1598(+)